VLLRLVKQVRYTYNEKKEKLTCNAKLQLLKPRDDRQKWLPHSYTNAVGNYKLRVRISLPAEIIFTCQLSKVSRRHYA
jgi:hypothetical protein